MDINAENLEQEANQLDNQENYNNEENGEEGVEGLNYEGEYDGQMEGEEEMVEMEQNDQEGEEEAIEGVEEEQAYNGEEEMINNDDNEEAKEKEGEEYVQQNEEEKKENEIKIEEKIENNSKNNIDIQNSDNKNNNSNNKKNISNKRRIELLNNKINSNNKAQTKKNENVIDKDIEEDDKNNNYKTFNFTKKNDVLSELLGKIQDFKQKKQETNLKLKTNNLEELDKELIKGLEKLNTTNSKVNAEINLNEEQKVSRPQFERKILRNPKFKEIVSLINEKDYKKSKYYYHNIGKNDFLDYMNNKYNSNFSNINFFNTKKSKYSSGVLEKNSFGNNYKKFGSDSTKVYVSCIDGKAIVNGIRKEIPFVSKFNYGDKLLNNNKSLFCDLYKTNNLGKSSRRNNSFNFKKYIKNDDFNFDGNKTQKKYINSGTKDFNFDKLKNDFYKENITNKLNKMNDNYFSRELKFFN